MVQVRVGAHFNEDGYSHGLALGLAERLRSSLAGVECADHPGEPSIHLRTEGVAQTLNDIHVDIEACCDTVEARVREVVARALKES